jgi:hypothetical protein
MTRRLLLATLAIFLFACSKSGPGAPPAPSASEPSVKTFKANVDFRGVSFRSDESLFSEVKAEVLPPTPLESPDDKPEDNWPEHARFSFAPPANQTRHPTFWEPELRVVDLAAYRDVYKVSPEYVDLLDVMIQWLKDAIDPGIASASRIPFLPFVDASQTFWVHLKRVDFAGGKGVAFVTQYDIEPSVVSNYGLTWIYQGVSDDGRNYVLATFPIRSSIASDDDDPIKPHRGYRPPQTFGEIEANQKAYEAYVAGVRKDLEAASPSKFEPDLGLLEKLIGSLRLNK